MSNKIGRISEWVLNLASVTAIAFTVTSLVVSHLGAKGPTEQGGLLKIGDAIRVPDVDWQRNHRTLVLALSTSCKFCGVSAPFYRALLATAGSGEWQSVAVMPQPVEVSTGYMQSKGYAVQTVRQIDLSTIRVSRTPTLLLVDERGHLQQQWIGMLSPADEVDVARHLGLKDWRRDRSRNGEESVHTWTSSGDSPLVTADELRAMLQRDHRLNVLDVRERSKYAAGRIGASLNIPSDELAVRAPHELIPNEPTVVYCRFQPACADLGIPSLCSKATAELRRSGVGNVRVIRESLTLLAQAGVPIVGSPNEQ